MDYISFGSNVVLSRLPLYSLKHTPIGVVNIFLLNTSILFRNKIIAVFLPKHRLLATRLNRCILYLRRFCNYSALMTKKCCPSKLLCTLLLLNLGGRLHSTKSSRTAIAPKGVCTTRLSAPVVACTFKAPN